MTGCFLGVVSLDFSEFWHIARNSYEVVHGRPNFGKSFLLQKLEKWAKNTPKVGFSEFKEKIGH